MQFNAVNQSINAVIQAQTKTNFETFQKLRISNLREHYFNLTVSGTGINYKYIPKFNRMIRIENTIYTQLSSH